MKKIKVLMIAGDMDVGGIEQQMMHVFRHADRRQFRFDFTSTKEDGFYRQEIEKLGGRWILIPRMNRKKPWHYCRALMQVMKQGNYDVVHTHELFHSGISLYLAWQAGIPCRVVHAHNCQDTDGSEEKRSWWRKCGKTGYQIVMRYLIRKYSTVQLYCSAWTGTFLYGKRVMEKDSCHLLYNSVDLNLFLNRAEAEENGIADVDVTKTERWINILHVGRITAVKNQIFLAELAAELKRRQKKWRILCVGDGDREETEKLRQRIIDTGAESHMLLLGRRRDIAKLMHQADLFILPSLYEGMPLVMLEAQAAGLPCISADTYSREVDLGLGQICWLSLDAGVQIWADAVEHALEKKPIPWRVVEQAVIEQGMDVKQYADRICDWYKKDLMKKREGQLKCRELKGKWLKECELKERRVTEGWLKERMSGKKGIKDGRSKSDHVEKIRLLFIISNLDCGGAQRVLLHLLDHMDRNRFSITVYTIAPIRDERIKTHLTKHKGIRVRTVISDEKIWKNHLYHGWFRLCMVLGIAGRLYIHGSYDVQVAWMETEATKLAAQLKAEHAVKIAWVHCDMSARKELRNRKVRERVRKQYDAFDQIVCVSKAVEGSFQALFGQQGKTMVLNNVLDAENIRKKAQERTDGRNRCEKSERIRKSVQNQDFQNRYHLIHEKFERKGKSVQGISNPKSTEEICFIAVGRLSEEKGYDDLLRACGKLRREGYSFVLDLIGEGPERHRLERLRERYHLRNQVRFWGFQSNPYPWIAAADLLVCSSHYEGSSTVTREALILGTPVLTTDCAGMRELLGDSEAGWIVEKGAEGLYRGMKNILDYREWLSLKAENARQRGAQMSLQEDIETIETFFRMAAERKTGNTYVVCNESSGGLEQ